MSNRFCPKCGAAAAEKAKFCGACGALMPSAEPAPDAAKGPADEPFLSPPPPLQTSHEPEDKGGGIVWRIEMTLLGNKFFWRDFLKWITLSTFLAGGILFAIFCGAGGAKGATTALYITLVGVALMTFSTVLFILIMGNRIPIEYTINGEGVNMKTLSKRTKVINRAVLIIGILARKPGAAGAGVIGMSQESTTILWKELSIVKWFPKDHVIFLRGNIFSRIRVYCTPENYSRVEKLIQENQGTKAG